jgi:hypothetical protein
MGIAAIANPNVEQIQTVVVWSVGMAIALGGLSEYVTATTNSTT